MQTERLVLSGHRDLQCAIDMPSGTSVVVACPPHPRHGGDRRDRRLNALAQELAASGIATLRFNYGPWDDGVGEREDARRAIAFAADRFPSVGVYGYSFGAAMAVFAATESTTVDAVSLLSPDAIVVDELAEISGPLQISYGERDDTVTWRPVVERARALNERGRSPPIDIVAWEADHHFVGQHEKVASTTKNFFVSHLTEPSD